MSSQAKPIKLTKLQRELLELLRDGALITVDSQNLAWLADRQVQPQTRYFLTENRLIARLDKTRSIQTKGNGFVISEKGRGLLGPSESS